MSEQNEEQKEIKTGVVVPPIPKPTPNIYQPTVVPPTPKPLPNIHQSVVVPPTPTQNDS